jgi:D-alanine-D-alanine ligase-like ATP-grasp enzyme
MSKVILWSSNPCGYSIRVLSAAQTIYEYTAGNSRQDSQVVLAPDDSDAVPEEELRQFAKNTAKEMAKEHDADAIEEDADFEVSTPW